MTTIALLKGILSISACLWLLYCFYITIKIKRFIVKRYEQDTNLLDTIFF
jgi:hypothetical protein